MKCKKDTENVDQKVLKTKKVRTILLSKYAVCSGKKTRYLKEQKAKWTLSSLKVKTSLSNIAILVKIMFYFYWM